MSTSELSEYQKTPRSTVNRLKTRGVYDQETIHGIIDSAPVLHVSFLPGTLDDDPFPAILPMLGCTGSFPASNEDLATKPSTPAPSIYLHGYVSSRLMRIPFSQLTLDNEEWNGHPISIAATHVDGIVLAYTPFNHSNNYRSAIIHGWAQVVTDPAEKLYALELITNNVLKDRWENSRIPPTDAELKSTGVLRVEIVSASAKIRAGPPGNAQADLQNEEMREKVWTGVIPSWVMYGEPIPAAENRVNAVPEEIRRWVDVENEHQKLHAIGVATKMAPKK